jgi:hypothetical protein
MPHLSLIPILALFEFLLRAHDIEPIAETFPEDAFVRGNYRGIVMPVAPIKNANNLRTHTLLEMSPTMANN